MRVLLPINNQINFSHSSCALELFSEYTGISSLFLHASELLAVKQQAATRP